MIGGSHREENLFFVGVGFGDDVSPLIKIYFK